MPTHQEVRTWARKFRNAYGKFLADHLRFWKKSLEIDPRRMLMLLGFAPQDVERLGSEIRLGRWESIADEAGESGWFVDGLLAELLSRYSYNWHSLASDLHGGHRDRERARPSRTVGTFESLPLVTPEGRDRILLNQIADGGPQALSALVDYLSGV